jgi:hypothetical protein
VATESRSWSSSVSGYEVARYGERTLSKYRQMMRQHAGALCPTGIVIPGDPLLAQVTQDWLNEFELSALRDINAPNVTSADPPPRYLMIESAFSSKSLSVLSYLVGFNGFGKHLQVTTMNKPRITKQLWNSTGISSRRTVLITLALLSTRANFTIVHGD